MVKKAIPFILIFACFISTEAFGGVLVPFQEEQVQTVGLKSNYNEYSNEKKAWYFKKNTTNEPTQGPTDIDLSKYNACYLGDTSRKVIYITFDQGYENGLTTSILDILQKKNVPAAFFMCNHYIKSSPDLVKRMMDEGHLVANHTNKHHSMPSLTAEQMAAEILECAELFKETAGVDMPLFFRPPMGEYSERSLAVTRDLGYKTVFWSFAYKDWIEKEQPGREKALKAMVDNMHSGCIMLLHAVSKSNEEALEEFIDTARAAGYDFESLTSLPN